MGVGTGVAAAATAPPPPAMVTEASSQYVILMSAKFCWVEYKKSVTEVPVAVASTDMDCQPPCICGLMKFDQTISASLGSVPPLGSIPTRVLAPDSAADSQIPVNSFLLLRALQAFRVAQPEPRTFVPGVMPVLTVW